jgi:DNA primase
VRETHCVDSAAKNYEAALSGSLGAEYLLRRGISIEIAQTLGIGYSRPGEWIHHSRDWKWGRLVFPHTDPTGQLLNLYGRAVGDEHKVPKNDRHDHLPGSTGYFNAAVLKHGEGALYVCEGPFDAVSMIAAGFSRSVAIFGVNGWRWEWARQVDEIVFALDADDTGQSAWKDLARQGRMHGKRVAVLTPNCYGGKKDINEAWVAGVLALEE